MKKTKNDEKSSEIIEIIKLMMVYDMSKTLSENKLFFEQKPDEMMPGQIERFGYKQDDPNTLAPALKKQSQHFQDVKKYFETWDKHDWLDLASIAVLIIPEAGYFLSLAIDTYNAALFVEEHRYYEAGIRIAFGLIPAGVIFAKMPAVRKYGIQPTIELLSKFSRVEKMQLNETEKLVLKQVKDAQPFLKSESQRIIFEETFKLAMENSTLWVLVRSLRIMQAKMPLVYLAGYVITSYYGIKWTYPKLAALFGVNASDLPNNEFGFKKYCEFMEITYVKYDNNSHIGIAKTEAGNLKFIYNSKNKLFEIKGSQDKLKNITTNNDVVISIQKTIEEKYPNQNQRDSAFNSVYESWGKDSVVSEHVKNQMEIKKVPQTDLWHPPMTIPNKEPKFKFGDTIKY